MPKIIIHLPDGTAAKYGLNGPSFTIGRSDGNDIILPAGAASSFHAVLKQNVSGDFTITDLESTNKTTVNGRPVRTAPLQNGDTLVFGDIAADYESEVIPSGTYLDDQPTQIYERAGAAPAAAGAGRPAPVVVAPQVIHRPVSTMARRNKSQDEGCFTMVVLAFVLPAAFFAGLLIRHHQDKGQWLWDYLAKR